MPSGLDHLAALRRNWLVIVGVIAAALVQAALITAFQKPVYQSSAQLIVAPALGGDTADVIRSLETLERRTVVATFARIAGTAYMRQRLAAGLKLKPLEAERFTTRGSVVPNTNIIRIEAEGPDPARTAAAANLAARETARQAESLYRVYTLRFLTPAVASKQPIYPDWKRNLLIGFVLGLFAGVAGALAVERVTQGAISRGA